jgi:large subunit ribosomal protein L23
MALFEKKTKGVKKESKAKKASSEKALADSKLETVLIAPWMSEKALIGTEKGAYVFEVALTATKAEIAKAVERIYKVVPAKITVLNVRGKSKALRGRRGFGVRAKRRKAYVHLAKGDTIQF